MEHGEAGEANLLHEKTTADSPKMGTKPRKISSCSDKCLQASVAFTY